MPAPWKKSYDKPRQHIKKQRYYFTNKDPCSQSYGFPSRHVWMRELAHKEGWAPINWCFWTVALEKTLESPFDCKEIKPVNPKGNQSWIVIRKTDAEAEAPKLWPPDPKNWLLGKDPDARKNWRQEKGTTEDKMVGWHHQLDGCKFEQVPGVGDGQGSLVCCSPWDHKESDTIEWLNRTEGPFCANLQEYIWIKFWQDAPCRTQPWNQQAIELGNVMILSSPVFPTKSEKPIQQ